MQRITAMDGAVGLGHSRMGEGNSVGSGGIDGVSNVGGAGCWLGPRSQCPAAELPSWAEAGIVDRTVAPAMP